MDRREFLETLARGALAVSGGLALNLLDGCSDQKSKIPEEISIDGKNYLIGNGVIRQKEELVRPFKLGILADTHAHSDNTRFFANQLIKEGVDAFILAGDLSWSFRDYEGSKDDYYEITSVIESVAQTGRLVLVYPGNHEQRVSYSRALENLTRDYNNVVDMERTAVADLNGATIVGLGGNDNARFNVQDGYLRSTIDFNRLGELAKEHQGEKPLLIATHIPQRYTTGRGLDVVENGKRNVGGVDLRRIRKALNSRFGLSGHIHEAYGIIGSEEQPVNQGELVDRLDLNPGAVFDHFKRPYLKPAAGILEFVGNQARGYIFNR